MHDECQVYMDSYMASNGYVSWHSERSQMLSYSILSCVRTLTIIVHPTMMGGPWTLLYGYLKVLWGDTMSGIFKALVAS